MDPKPTRRGVQNASIVFVDSGVAVGTEQGITWIERAGWSVHKYAALDSFPERVHVEVVHHVLAIVLRKVRFPAKAVAQSQVWKKLPTVLRIKPDIPVSHEQLVRSALLNICNSAGHKVRQRQTGNSTGYRDRAGGESVSRTIRFEAHHAAPEGHLMFAFDDAQVITEGYDCRAEFGGRGDQPAGYVSTGHKIGRAS